MFTAREKTTATVILSEEVAATVDVGNVVLEVVEGEGFGVPGAEVVDIIRAFIAPAPKHRKTVKTSLVEVGVTGNGGKTEILVTDTQVRMLETGDWWLYVGREKPVLL